MAYEQEYQEARDTLQLSVRTASAYVAQLGALAPILIPPFPQATLGRKPGFQATVLDQKYWFAKLYELVTYEELGYSTHTNYPGFSLHFMKVFYGMYYSAVTNYSKQIFTQVSPLWVDHLNGLKDKDGRPADPCTMEAVQHSVRTGATAHIQGDMPVALAVGYKTWKADSKPAFADLKNDFIVKSEGAFAKAQARFYIEVNDKIYSPLRPEAGQLAAVLYQSVFDIQPSLQVMFQWRREAWQKAANALASNP